MKRLDFLFVAVLLLVGTISCNSKKTNFVDEHSAALSLDWVGTYSGILPCADCEGIETALTLNADSTYSLLSIYLGADGFVADTVKGNFVWVSGGNVVQLRGKNDDGGSNLYKVEENRIRCLDTEGNVIEGVLSDYYVLTKNGNAQVEDVKWQLVELNGKAIEADAENYYLIFHSADGRAEAKAGCNILLSNYKITNMLSVHFESGISTRMACPDDTEQQLLQVLGLVDNLTTDGELLTLNKAKMAPLARFELVKE